MEVHSNPDSMDKTIKVKDVDSIPGLHISMESKKECVIIVEYKNQIINFQYCHDGLYYYDTFNELISHINSYFLKHHEIQQVII